MVMILLRKYATYLIVMLKNQEQLFSAKDFINLTKNNKTIILIFALIGFMFAMSIFPKYSATVTINISEPANSGLDIGSFSSNIFSVNQKVIEKQPQIITSQRVLDPVIEKMDLNIILTPKPSIFGSRWDNLLSNIQSIFDNHENKKVKNIVFSKFVVSPNLLGQEFEIIQIDSSHYSLKSKEGTILLENAKINNVYTKKIKDDFFTINVKKLQAEKGNVFLLKKISDREAYNHLKTHISTREYANSGILLISYTSEDQFNLNNIVNEIAISTIKTDVTFKTEAKERVLDFMESQLPAVEKKLGTAQKNLSEYRSKSGNVSLEAQTKMAFSLLADYNRKISELEMQKSQSEQVLTEHNPELKQISLALKNLKKQRDLLESNISKIPNSDLTYTDLKREVEIQNAVYEALLSKITKYNILRAASDTPLQILDFSDHIVSANSLLKNTILSIVTAILLALLLIFIQCYFLGGIRNPSQIESILKAPFVGFVFKNMFQIKQNKAKHKPLKLLSEVNLQDLTLEGLRSIKTALKMQSIERNKKIFCISGPSQGIGKSFISANLSQLFGIDKKVLLIDADLRCGHLSDYFKPKYRVGLSEYLTDEVKMEEIISKTRFENIDFIPRGRMRTNSFEILSRKNYNLLLDQISVKYDYIFIDAPPVLSLSDALLILNVDSINLLIFDSTKHDAKEIIITKNKFDQNKIKIDGFILNKVSRKDNYFFSALSEYKYYGTK